METPERKKCSLCKRMKSAAAFKPNPNLKSGLYSRCNPCEDKYRKEYYIRNRKHILERAKEYQQENSNYIYEKHKEYYKKPEVKARCQKYQVKYYAKNKERMLKYAKEYQAKHRKQLRDNALKFYYENRERLLAERKEKRRKAKCI